MNVKNNGFVAFTKKLIFSNKHKICSGGSWYDRSHHYSTPKTAKLKFSKRMTGNWNANKKEEINEGEMQTANVFRKNITKKLIYVETFDWYAWPQHL